MELNIFRSELNGDLNKNETQMFRLPLGCAELALQNQGKSPRPLSGSNVLSVLTIMHYIATNSSSLNGSRFAFSYSLVIQESNDNYP